MSSSKITYILAGSTLAVLGFTACASSLKELVDNIQGKSKRVFLGKNDKWWWAAYSSSMFMVGLTGVALALDNKNNEPSVPGLITGT